jgi:heme exporter protein D
MGFFFSLLLLGIVLYGVFRYVTNAEARAEAHRAFTAAPLKSTFIWTGVGCTLMFFLGVFIPPLGILELPGLHWKLVTVGLTGASVFALVVVVAQSVREKRDRGERALDKLSEIDRDGR